MVPRSKQTIVYGAQEIESERMWAQIPGSIAEWKEPLGSTVNRVALDSVNVPVFYLDNNEPLYIFFSLFLMKCSYVHKAQNVSCWILQEKKKKRFLNGARVLPLRHGAEGKNLWNFCYQQTHINTEMPQFQAKYFFLLLQRWKECWNETI